MIRSYFNKYIVLNVALTLLMIGQAQAEDGYEMWLRYQPIANEKLLKNYRNTISQIVVQGDSAVLQKASTELQRGLGGLLVKPIAVVNAAQSNSLAYKTPANNALIIGTPKTSSLIAALVPLKNYNNWAMKVIFCGVPNWINTRCW